MASPIRCRLFDLSFILESLRSTVHMNICARLIWGGQLFCEMSMLGLSKLPKAERGVICAGTIWGGCLLCEVFVLGLSKVPWAQRGVNCKRFAVPAEATSSYGPIE